MAAKLWIIAFGALVAVALTAPIYDSIVPENEDEPGNAAAATLISETDEVGCHWFCRFTSKDYHFGSSILIKNQGGMPWFGATLCVSYAPKMHKYKKKMAVLRKRQKINAFKDQSCVDRGYLKVVSPKKSGEKKGYQTYMKSAAAYAAVLKKRAALEARAAAKERKSKVTPSPTPMATPKPCAVWACTCQGLSDRYGTESCSPHRHFWRLCGTDPGSSPDGWGTATPVAIRWWKAHKCKTMPCTKHRKSHGLCDSAWKDDALPEDNDDKPDPYEHVSDETKHEKKVAKEDKIDDENPTVMAMERKMKARDD